MHIKRPLFATTPAILALINVADQEGNLKGVRVVYIRRLSRHRTAFAGSLGECRAVLASFIDKLFLISWRGIVSRYKDKTFVLQVVL
jgi:hypothetical protein